MNTLLDQELSADHQTRLHDGLRDFDMEEEPHGQRTFRTVSLGSPIA